ncbi:hypothetical protein B0H66DRAFT_297105 [Apodospora peruviana]|uniref:Uncharacterized protein n=1 Tax=Apodospora peruviana TaxID=516989 RepID=A0AAE0M250_9PEZI|nr:hypothetical protein B0H66DRAFT_297105 [Apodospora peruviana]
MLTCSTCLADTLCAFAKRNNRPTWAVYRRDWRGNGKAPTVAKGQGQVMVLPQLPKFRLNFTRGSLTGFFNLNASDHFPRNASLRRNVFLRQERRSHSFLERPSRTHSADKCGRADAIPPKRLCRASHSAHAESRNDLQSPIQGRISISLLSCLSNPPRECNRPRTSLAEGSRTSNFSFLLSLALSRARHGFLSFRMASDQDHTDRSISYSFVTLDDGGSISSPSYVTALSHLTIPDSTEEQSSTDADDAGDDDDGDTEMGEAPTAQTPPTTVVADSTTASTTPTNSAIAGPSTAPATPAPRACPPSIFDKKTFLPNDPDDHKVWFTPRVSPVWMSLITYRRETIAKGADSGHHFLHKVLTKHPELHGYPHQYKVNVEWELGRYGMYGLRWSQPTTNAMATRKYNGKTLLEHLDIIRNWAGDAPDWRTAHARWRKSARTGGIWTDENELIRFPRDGISDEIFLHFVIGGLYKANEKITRDEIVHWCFTEGLIRRVLAAHFHFMVRYAGVEEWESDVDRNFWVGHPDYREDKHDHRGMLISSTPGHPKRPLQRRKKNSMWHWEVSQGLGRVEGKTEEDDETYVDDGGRRSSSDSGNAAAKDAKAVQRALTSDRFALQYETRLTKRMRMTQQTEATDKEAIADEGRAGSIGANSAYMDLDGDANGADKNIYDSDDDEGDSGENEGESEEEDSDDQDSDEEVPNQKYSDGEDSDEEESDEEDK